MSALLGLFSCVTGSTWIKVGAIVALGIAVMLSIQHIKDGQKAKDIAVAQAAIAKQVIHNAAVQATAQGAINAAVNTYEQDTVVPALAPLPVLLCHAATTGSAVPGGTGAAQAVNGATATSGLLPAAGAVESGSVSVNAAGIVGDAERADQLSAEVALLQNVVRSYQQEGVVQSAATSAPAATSARSVH